MLALRQWRRRTLWLCSLLVSGTAQAATVYRYMDSSGEVVFSSAPPPGAKADTLTINSTQAPTASPVPAPREPVPAKPATPKEPSAETRVRNCARARHALEGLEQSPRLRVRNKEGYEYYMDGEERARRIATAERSVAAWCDATADGLENQP